MHSAHVIAWTLDGAIYCPDCKPTPRRSPEDLSAVFADAADGMRGSTCDSCAACFVDGDWSPHDYATGPAVRWATCTACNGQKPYSMQTSDYREARRAFARLGSRACPDCLRGRMLFR